MRYTKSNKADKIVEKDLEIIKKIIVKELKPISIILFGGFGRGEGSFEVIGNKISPLNDYDMYVVTKKKISEERLEEVGLECSNAIGKGGREFVEKFREVYDKNKFFHVDLRWLNYSRLGKLKRINRTYELKYGSTIIYGEDVRKKINDISVPLSEAFRYLINPACHLLVVMDERRLEGKWQKDEELYAQHHIVKTYLAIASSLIISEGKFKANYTDTVNEFKKLYGKKFPKLTKKIEESLDLKVKAHKKMKDLKKRWFEARNDLTFALKYISKKHLDIDAKEVKELVEKLYGKLPYTYFIPYLPFPKSIAKIAFPSQFFLNIIYFKRTGYFKVLLNWKDVGLRIALSAFLLLSAVDDKSLIDGAYSYIKTFARVKSKTWKDLRIALLYSFDRYYSQKLI
ncbi:hypothetical protein KAT24_00640 [Candidatus Pacearchaeota archaeon]|nr:hypothetical protein [Candidatus Pacearchaeota archaeon]